MERILRQPLAETAKIFLTGKSVRSSEAAIAIPEGFRQATLDEVALRFRNDGDFRKELTNIDWVWVAQKGLSSSKYHLINESGAFVKIDKDTFYAMPTEERAYHYSGKGAVAVMGSCMESTWGLDVSADASLDIARVAYVRSGDATGRSEENATWNISLPLRILKALKGAFRKTGAKAHLGLPLR